MIDTLFLICSASLRGYTDLVRTLGHEPQPLLHAAGLSARLLAGAQGVLTGLCLVPM